MLDQFVDGRAVSALQRKLQQDIAPVGVSMLHAGRLVRFPLIERADELRQRVAPIRPRRMVLRQQQPRRVGREVAERDAADIIVSRQLGYIFGHRLLERELAVAHRLRQQRGLEYFAQRCEVEQRVARDRPFAGTIGPAIIEEEGAAFDAHCHRNAASAIRRYDRVDVACNSPSRIVTRAGSGRDEYDDHGRDCEAHGAAHPPFTVIMGHMGRGESAI